MHSRNDEIVPLGLSQKLFNAALSPKYFTELAGSHNTAFLDAREKYLSAITDFIRQLPP